MKREKGAPFSFEHQKAFNIGQGGGGGGVHIYVNISDFFLRVRIS